MQSVTLAAALGQILHINQFFVWRLTWDESAGKFQKTPWRDGYPIDAQRPDAWMSYAEAVQQMHVMAGAGQHCALGWMMTPGCGYWFLDIDNCVNAGQLSPLAAQLVAALPGCMLEYSSSGTGLHIIGRGLLPEHAKRCTAHGLELYTELRGIAFGLSGYAWGCADTEAPGILQIAAEYFPPRAAGDTASDWDGPRSDWAGPTDDAELLRRALASASVAARFGSKASFAQLWNNAPELDKFYGPDSGSERDAALASHLAFWTGCDGPRMERLMRQSALYRSKWDEHRTYLRELTINNACANQRDVLQDRPRVDVNAEMYGTPSPALPPLPAASGPAPVPAAPVVAPLVSTELAARVESLLDLVTGCGTWADIHNTAIPAIRNAGIPPALMPRLESAVNKRLDMFDAKLPVAKLRALLNPPRVAAPDGEGDGMSITRPEWAGNYVYLRQADAFFSIPEALPVSRAALGATHDRDMPIKGDGPDRHSAAAYMLQHWGCPIVHDTMYRPGAPAITEHDGLKWANLYNESTHPATTEAYTPEGLRGIEMFTRLLWLQCGQRERVYMTLLAWMAHNVQRPGHKIRWVPLLKGAQGDGKSTIAEVLQAVMGWRNVKTVGPAIVANSGGFTDWAHGSAVVALEEIYIAGRERHKIANAIKEFISNNVVSINPKGDKPKKVLNTCNQIAFTNHADGVPIDDAEGDRRWFVVFTPFSNRAQVYQALGVTEARHFFDPMYASLRGHAGEWRKWLLEMPIPDWFDVDGAAQITEEKRTMSSAGVDDVEMLARDLIAEGGHGVTKLVISSASFSNLMRTRSFADGVDVPKGQSLHHMFLRLGYLRVEKSLKWDGRAHRVWVAAGVDTSPDNLRKILDESTVTAT